MNGIQKRKTAIPALGEEERIYPATFYELLPQQQKFLLEYLSDGKYNGTQAAIRAGYSAHSAAQLASFLLSRPKIRATVEAMMDQALYAAGISNARILKELSHVAFLDPRDLTDASGALLPMSQIPPEARVAIREYETTLFTSNGIGQSVKTHDKLRALELLGKYKQLFVDKVEHVPGGELAALLQRMAAHTPPRSLGVTKVLPADLDE